MALVNKLGGLFKKATRSNLSLYQAIRCMSSNAPAVLKTKEEEENRKRAISQLVYTSSLYKKSICSALSPFTRNRKRIKKIKLPTHYLEVNYKIRKAVVYYGPNIRHIPQVSSAITAMDDGKEAEERL